MVQPRHDQGRDVETVIAMVRERLPTLRVEQLQVKFPADDDGLWFFKLPDGHVEAQIESSTRRCPFLVESDANANRLDCDSIAATAEAVITILQGDTSVS